MMNKNCPIFDIYNEKNLKGFTTTENDAKRGMSRFPVATFRNKKVDLLQGVQEEEEKDENLDYDEAKGLRNK